MDPQPASSLNSSGRDPVWKLTQLVLEHRQLLQLSRRKDEEAYFVDYVPPARDAITLPRNVVYVLVGVILVIVATYAIVGHLIKDLMHDLADWILGPKPMEEDTEAELSEAEEERRASVCSKLREKYSMEMEAEREGLLPGLQHGTGSCHQSTPPPLCSAIASGPGDKRMSTHNVTFASPAPSYATSL